MKTSTRRAAIGAAAVLASALAPVRRNALPRVGTPSTDHELMRLSEMLDEALRLEATTLAVARASGIDDDDHPVWVTYDQADDATGLIVEQIERQRATTLEGLLVKARAVRWCRCSRETGPQFFDELLDEIASAGSTHAITQDERVMRSMLADLYAMTEGKEARATCFIPLLRPPLV